MVESLVGADQVERDLFVGGLLLAPGSEAPHDTLFGGGERAQVEARPAKRGITMGTRGLGRELSRTPQGGATELGRPAPLLLQPVGQFPEQAERDDRVESGIVELVTTERTSAPVAALVCLIESQVEEVAGDRGEAVRFEGQGTTREFEGIDKAGRIKASLAQNPLVEAGVVGCHNDPRVVDQWPDDLDAGGKSVDHHHPPPGRSQLKEAQLVLPALGVVERLGIETYHLLPGEVRDYLADIVRIDQVVVLEGLLHNSERGRRSTLDGQRPDRVQPNDIAQIEPQRSPFKAGQPGSAAEQRGERR